MAQLHSKETPDRDPLFVSLGMAVIDELRFPTEVVLSDVPGGSGMYGVCPHPPYSSTPERWPAKAY
jgi:hypothetical protein